MHSGDLADALDDLFQVFEVGDVEDDVDIGLSVGCAGFDVADIRFAVADDSSDLLEHSETVVAVERQFHRVGGWRAVGIVSPLDVNLAVRLIHERGDIGTVDGVDRNTFSARHVSDDGFPANRIAAPRAIDKQISVSLDGDRIGIATEDAADDIREGGRLFPGASG